MKARDFVKKLDDKKIAEAIAGVEKTTSGEIRVVVDSRDARDALEAAKTEFFKLGMDKTRDRNAVLIYFAPKTRQFALWGDAAVHQKCGDDFWKKIASEMTDLLRQEKFTEAIVLAVNRVGETLTRHFPKMPDDTNELPDDVVFREPPQ
ncbi:MAG: TPM domain-containing protein [Verrucomicrobiia bacterium]